MTYTQLVRPALGLALTAMAITGCVAPPPPQVVPGTTYLSQQCAAGFYQCVLATPGPVGSPCACPGIGAPSYGSIR